VDFSFDWRVFTYSMAAALFTGVFIGIWPALRASQARAGVALHDGDRSNSGGAQRQRMRSLLVVGQVAGSLVLLICAALFIRSLRGAQRLDLGFAPDHLLNARMNPLWAGYDQQRTKSFYQELERRVRAWPEVRSASLAFGVPLSPIMSGQPVFIEGRPQVPGEQPFMSGCNYVDPGYFQTMQIRILRGRAFLESDNETARRVAIVNETMANRYWPNEDPIGKRFHAGTPESPAWEVVGVAQDGKYLLVIESPLPFFYVPLDQNYLPMRVLQIRTSVPPESLSVRLEREIHSLDPGLPIAELKTMEQSLGSVQGFLIFRIGAVQTAAMGILGLVLALLGVYGVVSYGAAQRTREIGIRMALGATPRAILGMILGRGVWMVVAGVLVGLLGAALLARVLGYFLLFVSATDPLTFLAVPAVLAVAALWACYIPARRATRVDPTVALRHE
jgi:putative ABC transport system permease protein